jgi:hypothetical protein
VQHDGTGVARMDVSLAPPPITSAGTVTALAQSRGDGGPRAEDRDVVVGEGVALVFNRRQNGALRMPEPVAERLVSC